MQTNVLTVVGKSAAESFCYTIKLTVKEFTFKSYWYISRYIVPCMVYTGYLHTSSNTDARKYNRIHSNTLCQWYICCAQTNTHRRCRVHIWFIHFSGIPLGNVAPHNTFDGARHRPNQTKHSKLFPTERESDKFLCARPFACVLCVLFVCVCEFIRSSALQRAPVVSVECGG